MCVSKCQRLWFSKQEKGAELESSSKTEHLILSYCNISNQLLPIVFTWFANVKDLDLSGNNFEILHACIKDCPFLRKLNLDDCKKIEEVKGLPWTLESLSANGCTSLKYLDFTGERPSLIRNLILDGCSFLYEVKGVLPNLDSFSAKNCTSLNNQSRWMIMNQKTVEAGNKIFSLPGTKIPDWFTHRISGESISFWFRGKFPVISLCLVIGQVDEKAITVKFSPKVFINGNKQFLGNRKVYEFMIGTDHILLFDISLLKFEDNEDAVFSYNNWNHVVFSYVDHINNDGVPIKVVAKYSGIHVSQQRSAMANIQFTNPLQSMLSVNLYPNSMETHIRGQNTADRPQKEQTKLLPSPILSSTQLQPLFTDVTHVRKGPDPKPIVPAKSFLEDVTGETSKRLSVEVVHPTTIPNDPPVIQSCSEGDDDIEQEAVYSSEHESDEESSYKTEPEEFSYKTESEEFYYKTESEESSYKTESEGSDSDDPFDCVDRRLDISAEETVSSASSSGDASLGSIREAINSLELLMVKDLSEVYSDPDAHQLLDLLSTSNHPKVTIEVKEAIVQFKREAFLSFQEFQSTVESVNKLKEFESHLTRIQQETVAGKDRWKDLKKSIKKVSSAIKAENSRKKESEAEIATLRIQLAKKEMDLEQLVLNIKNHEETLSTYSTSYASLNEQARTLLEEANDLLAASSGVKNEGKGAEEKQRMLKSTWSIHLTNQFNQIKNNIIHLL
ncbi:hypothetical protein TSUD_364810 [Trifolium subterraneum]|uniref:Uncharacterized protein n=1 Tax=Trifolium subterraneum TaxID=3900 RepID=A0A2Z6NTI1_TRISU|nr:hypothetical protein TSUD_364810 [Trifolium subterraneum]